MQAAFVHALMLSVAAALAWFGWFMAHNPERAIRFFTFGTEPAFGKRFALTWSRAVGWTFTVGGCLGSMLYLVLISVDLFHSHL
jgi:hypothetical protein